MHRRTHRSISPKSVRTRQGRVRIVVLGVVAVFLVIALVAFRSLSSSDSYEPAPVAGALPDDVDLLGEASGLLPSLASAPAPVVYPYSVVPGGVSSVEEFANARGRDPVVAKHYDDISLAALKVERVDKPRAAYMSYRKGGQIYWTKKKLALKVGEQVLTDGDTTIRGRCGNRLSETPMLPTSAEEPSVAAFEETLDTPGAQVNANQPNFGPVGGIPLLAALAPNGSASGGTGPGYGGGSGGGAAGGGGGAFGGGGGVGGGPASSKSSTPSEEGTSDNHEDSSSSPGDPGEPGNPGGGNPGGGPKDGSPSGPSDGGGPGPNGGSPSDNPPPGDGGPGPNPPGGDSPHDVPPGIVNPDPPGGGGGDNPPTDQPPHRETQPLDTVPEPASLVLLGTGAAWALRRYRTQRSRTR